MDYLQVSYIDYLFTIPLAQNNFACLAYEPHKKKLG